MLNDTIRLTAKVRHVQGGRIGTVIGHVKGSKGWLHLVECKVGKRKSRMWFGRNVLVEIAG